MHESLEKMIDRARQRHFSDEELTLVSRSASRMEHGCDVVEKIRTSERELLTRSVSKALQKFPNVEAENPAARDLITAVLTMGLRQAALAMALDDSAKYSKILVGLQRPIWDAQFEPEFVQNAVENLRDESMATLGKALGRQFDQVLKPMARFLTINAYLAVTKDAVLGEATEDILSLNPDLESKFADARRKIHEDLEKYLIYAAQGVLPDGQERIFRMLRTYHEAAARSRYGSALMLEATEALMDAARKYINPGPTVEFFSDLQRIVNFITLSADVVEKKDAMLEKVTETLYRRHPDKLKSAENIKELTKRDMWVVLENCIYGTHAGGRERMLEVMSEFNLTLFRFQFGPRLIIDAYQLLLQTCRAELHGGALASLEPVLHKAIHFVAISADLAEKQPAMLEGLAEELAKKYDAFYGRRETAKIYVIRDQEQVLHNLSIGLLPGSKHLTVGRFSVFGEYLAHARFDEKMMHESTELLEAACMTNLSAQSLSHLIPRMRLTRRYLDLCSSLAPREEKILKETAEAILAKYTTFVEKYPDGVAKVSRDLATMLHTAAVSIIPDGEMALHRGLEAFYDNIIETRMDKGMLDFAYRALIKAVTTHLPSPHKDWLLPILETCTTFIHAAADVAENRETILTQSVDAAFAKHPDMEARFPGARRKAEEDFDLLLRRCTLALVPNGEENLADGMWIFCQSLFASGYGPKFITEAHAELRKVFGKYSDRPTNTAVGAIMDRVVATSAAFAELAEKEDIILHEATNVLYSKHPQIAERHRNAKAKTQRDMAQVLRHAALLGVPGAEKRFITLMRTLTEVITKGKFGAAFIHDAYEMLRGAADAHLPKHAKKQLARPLEVTRDYLSLVAGLGDHEDEILTESLDKLFAKRGTQMAKYMDVKEQTRHDERMILRSAALSLVPGGEREHARLLELMGVVVQRNQFDKPMLVDAYTALTDSCTARLKHGPVKQLVSTVQKSVQTFA